MSLHFQKFFKSFQLSCACLAGGSIKCKLISLGVDHSCYKWLNEVHQLKTLGIMKKLRNGHLLLFCVLLLLLLLLGSPSESTASLMMIAVVVFSFNRAINNNK